MKEKEEKRIAEMKAKKGQQKKKVGKVESTDVLNRKDSKRTANDGSSTDSLLISINLGTHHINIKVFYNSCRKWKIEKLPKKKQGSARQLEMAGN